METEQKHLTLYGEVQESFVANLVKAVRVGGGVTATGELKKISKGTFAEVCNLSSGTITKLTSTDTENVKPDLETLCKLGHALNVSPAFLLMTPRDWIVLIQAFSTIDTLVNPTGEHEQRLVNILRSAVGSEKIDETVVTGLNFVKELRGDDYSSDDRARQRNGILAMTAMAQGSIKRQGSAPKMFATALGAILGDREISQY